MIAEIAELALLSSETGYETAPLQDDQEFLCLSTFRTLKQMGISLPDEFPPELDEFLSNTDLDEDHEDIPSNPYADVIRQIFDAYIDVHGFFTAYVQELVDDDRLDILEIGIEMESCLIDLAASKIESPGEIAPKFLEYRYETLQDYKNWIEAVKSSAIKNATPLRAELNNLIVDNHDSLGFEAEAESLGVNSGRLHPDIYMNEVLQTGQMLQRFIPAIAKKLGITPDELGLD